MISLNFIIFWIVQQEKYKVPESIQLSTKEDVVRYDAYMQKIKNQFGLLKYKNFLLPTYLRALQIGDTQLFKYTRKKLRKSYSVLGFDTEARRLDIKQCIAALREVFSEQQQESI